MHIVDPTPDPVLTERETDIMNVLWLRGSGTVAEVLADLSDELAYTTVLTVLRTLESKGLVDHAEEGRAHRYRPLVAREAARRTALERLKDRLFEGSPEALMAHLISGEGLEDDQLRRLRELVDRRLRDAEGEEE